MRYMFQDHHTIEPETLHVFYETALRWAVEHGISFVITLYPRDYHDLADIERVATLGRSSRMLRHGEDVIEVAGVLGAGFLEALAHTAIPPGANAGDLCPVGDLRVSCQDRILYHVCEYGRDQLFELTEEERTELRARLAEAGLVPALLVPIPEY